MEPKVRALLTSGKRYANLDEFNVGKEYYNGDSMMIVELTKKRKELKNLKKNLKLHCQFLKNTLKKQILKWCLCVLFICLMKKKLLNVIILIYKNNH